MGDSRRRYRLAWALVFLGAAAVVSPAAEGLADGKPTREQQALARAVRQGKVDEVRKQLAQGVTPTLDAIFHAAGKRGDAEVLAALLGAGVDVGMERRYPGLEQLSETLLGTAVAAGRVDLARLLLERGADPRHPHKSRSLAAWAAEIGSGELLGLVAAGPEDLNRADAMGWTPLHYAAIGGGLDAVRVALARGADPNPRDTHGQTPFAWACTKGHLEIVDALTQAGAEGTCTATRPADPKPTRDQQALARVMRAGNVGEVRKHLAQGVTPHPDALFLAVEKGQAEVLGVLLDAGADAGMERPLPRNAELTRTLLGSAVERGEADIARLLLDKGADPRRPHRGRPLALWAVERGDIGLLALVSPDAGAVNLADAAGRTALHYAVVHAAITGKDEVLHAALKLGADPNREDREGHSALHLACAKGFSDVARILLESGADPNARTRDGVAPLTLAVERGSDSTVRVLLAAGADAPGASEAQAAAGAPAEEDDAATALLEDDDPAGASAQPWRGKGRGPDGRDAEVFPGLEELGRVTAWRLTFSYRQSFEVREDLENVGSTEKSLRAEFAGGAEFTGGGAGRFRATQGQASYDYRRSSETTYVTSDTRILSREEGAGMAVLGHESVLELDFEEMTYRFELHPGGEEGFEVKSEWAMDPGLEESMDDSFTAMGLPKFQEQMGFHRAVLDATRAQGGNLEQIDQWENFVDGWEAFVQSDPYRDRGDDRQTYEIQIPPYPLPFFGTVLAGSYTDYQGGVVAWRLEPVAPGTNAGQERATGSEDVLPSECWTHYHPMDSRTREEIVSMGAKLAEAVAGRKELERTAAPEREPFVYLFQPGLQGASGPTVCGDTLVPVKVENNYPVSSTPDSQSFYSFPDTGSEPGDSSGDLLERVHHLFAASPSGVDDGTRYNPLDRYPLIRLMGAHLDGGKAVIHLKGTFEEQQPCDREKIAAQITETARQSGSIARVSILLNGRKF